MAKFKCKLSGCVYEFTNEVDVEELRKHEEYEEVTEEVKTTEIKKQKPVKE